MKECLSRLTAGSADGPEERWWRELQLAASASAGELAANFGLFFSGALLNPYRAATVRERTNAMITAARVSLLWRVLLSTSIAVTLLFGVTGWIVQDNATRATATSLDEEVRASFHAYDSLWQSRADMLASVSLVVSRMSDVRAAFSTGDAATIRDTAKELWDKISREDAIFLVTDP